MFRAISLFLLFCAIVTPSLAALADAYNCSLVLATKPTCGSFGASAFINVNEGISLAQIKNVIPFGDSWTAMNDSTGVYPPPLAVITGTNPMAGGRASNGPTWTEYIANDINAPVHPFAVGGAVTNLTLWPTAVARNISISSFISQTDTFAKLKPTFDPASTLFTVFFGINDYTYSKTDGSDKLLQAAATIKTEILRLINAGAHNILTVGVYFNGAGVTAFEDQIFADTADYRTDFGVNVAYASFLPLWQAISANPSSFGLTSTATCLASDSTTVGACAEPESTLYWQHAHPSTCVHRLMADWIESVLGTC